MDRDDLGPKYFSEVCVFLELCFHYKQRVPLRLIADEPFGPLALHRASPFQLTSMSPVFLCLPRSLQLSPQFL